MLLLCLCDWKLAKSFYFWRMCLRSRQGYYSMLLFTAPHYSLFVWVKEKSPLLDKKCECLYNDFWIDILIRIASRTSRFYFCRCCFIKLISSRIVIPAYKYYDWQRDWIFRNIVCWYWIVIYNCEQGLNSNKSCLGFLQFIFFFEVVFKKNQAWI